MKNPIKKNKHIKKDCRKTNVSHNDSVELIQYTWFGDVIFKNLRVEL